MFSSQNLSSRLTKYLQHTVFKNFSYLLINHILSQFLMFSAYSILARRISVEAVGVFGYAQVYYNYFLIMLNLGLPLYAIKKYPILTTESSKNELINLFITIRLFLFLLLITPYWVVAHFVAKNDITLKIILLLSFGLFVMVFNLEWYFRAIQKMYFIAIGNVSKSLFFLVGVIFLVKRDESLPLLAYIFVTAFLCMVIIYLFFSKVFRKIKFIFKIGEMLPVIKESVILGVSIILIQVYYSFGTFSIGFFRNTIEVGYYTNVYKLLMFFLAIVSLYLKAVFPHMASISTDTEKLKKFIVTLTRFAFLTSFVVTILIFFVAEKIVVLAFSQKYLPAVGPFRILILIFWIIASRTLIENSLIINNQSSKYLITVLIGASTNIVLNLLLVPLYGVYGAAVATLVSEIVFTLTAIYFSKISFASLIGYTK